MEYYGNNDYGDYLSHYGILGMHWGIRRFQPYSVHPRKGGGGGKEVGEAIKNRKELAGLYKSKSANLNSWGTDKNHNVLYITGLSGSGKSTVSRRLAEKINCDVIHLDFYFNQMSDQSRREYQSKEFNKYLDKKVPGWRNIPQDSPQKVDWKMVDKFAKAIETYGSLQYSKGRRVIAEGVEIMDSTLYVNRESYKDKPYVMLNTSAITSHIRGNKRDGMTGLDFFYRVPMYIKTSKIKSDAINELALKGMRAVDIDAFIDKNKRIKQ